MGIERATIVADAVRSLTIAWMACFLLTVGAAGCGPHESKPTPTTAAAAVRGRVSGADGKPLSGVHVTISAEPDDGRVAMGSTRTSAVGAYRIDRLVPGHYRLHLRAPGHVAVGVTADISAAREKTIDVTLIRTVKLAGHVVDERHTPVPLARVLVFAVADGDSRAVHEASANERGAFEIAGLAPGAHRLLIEAPGLGTVGAGPVIAPDEQVLVIVPGEIRAIVGRVTRDGQPVRNARVLLGGEGVAEPRSTDTTTDGRFAFGGLGPGTYILRAEQGGAVAPTMTHIVVDRSASQTRSVELVISPGNFVRGRVVGQDGAPVAGALVQIDLVPATGLIASVAADRDGNWTSPPLGPGRYEVRARHAGAVARRTMAVDVGPAAPPSTIGPLAGALPPVITLELVRTGRISGRVVDEHGSPVIGASVDDRLAEAEELGVIWSRLPLAAEAAALPSGTMLPSVTPGLPAARRATTDATGRFVLDDVPPGRVRIEVLNPSSIPLRTAPHALAPGATLDLGTLQVKRAVPVAGRVLDELGQPLGGVRIGASTVTSTTALDAGAALYAVTSDDGMFSLPLAIGEHRLRASAEGRADVVETIRVGAAGAATPFVTLRFAGRQASAGDFVLQGWVRDGDQRPLAGAKVSAHLVRPPGTSADDATSRWLAPPSSSPSTSPSPSPPPPVATATADAGGGFRLPGLPSLPMIVVVTHPRYPVHRQLVDITALRGAGQSTPVEFRVAVPGGIDGEIHERITGAPVVGFHIEARGPDGAVARFPEAPTRRRATGPLRFSLRRLAPGPWTLRVEAPGFRTIEREVDVAASTSLGEASVRDLRLELERV